MQGYTYRNMNESTSSIRQVFNQLAAHYDTIFTNTDIGRMLRQRTHDLLNGMFTPGQTVLVLNCGTGEDVIHLARQGINVLASDNSEEMIKFAKIKVNQAGLNHMVEFRQINFDKLDYSLSSGETFDGIISNFGGINCSSDISQVVKNIADYLRPGGKLYLCIMGQFVPWEWLYLGVRGRYKRIYHRFRGSCIWRGQEIKYYSPAEIETYLSIHYRSTQCSGLGFLIPPSYAGKFFSKFPRVFYFLNWVEKHLETFFPIPLLSDHFVFKSIRK